MINMGEIYSCYVNISYRTDRRKSIEEQLKKVKIKAERIEAILPDEIKNINERMPVMSTGTRGAAGCFLSQIKGMLDALQENKHAMVFEDDCIFCEDFNERLEYIFNFLNKQNYWDICWLGCTMHREPTWHKLGHPLPQIRGHCYCTLNRDWEKTKDKRIVRTYGIWSTYAYIVNRDSISKVVDMLEETIPQSPGIDTSMIWIQPKLKCYAFVPGSVKQFDNLSNIGTGITQFSNFYHLGEHWYQDKMDNFDYDKFYGK